MIRFFYALFILNFLGLLALFFVADLNAIINFELAVFSSLFISLGSFKGYKNLVQNAQKNALDLQNLDLQDTQDLTNTQDLAENEEKIKKALIFSSFKAVFSLYRILGYLVLFISLLALNYYGIFSPIFLLGLFVVPFCVFFVKR